MNVSDPFPVLESSQIAVPRRAAMWLAEQLGFSDERCGRVALIVSELGTNLVKHARGGEILLRVVCTASGERDGVEIAAIDKGPGMTDPARSRADGYSTSGSLGHGLGAIERHADSFDLYTHTTGTAIVAAMRRDNPLRTAAGGKARYEVGAVLVAKPGEDVCGDAWACRTRDGRVSILVADGLGHGLHAHEAAETAIQVFSKAHENPPARVIEDVHAALRATRGAAVAMLSLDLERGTARYAGLGNIASAIVTPGGGRQYLISHNGTAGHTAARIQEFNYPLPDGSIVVMASDGLTTHWDLTPYPGLLRRTASVIAAVLYRDFSRRRDDVTIVVAKERPPLAEKL